MNGIVEVGGPRAVPHGRARPPRAEAQDDPREVVADPAATYYGAYAVDDSTLVPAADALTGEVRFADWFERQLAAA